MDLTLRVEYWMKFCMKLTAETQYHKEFFGEVKYMNIFTNS
jgi:hypothetical protein